MCEMAEYLFKVEVFLLSGVNDIFIHRLVPVDMCFEKFNKTLSERYKIPAKSKYMMTWIDAEDDLIRIFNESDFMLFVELKGTKIYVIDESIYNEWFDRRIPQNGRDIDESYGAITAVSEKTSNEDDLMEVAHETTNARTNFMISETVPESVILLDVEGNRENPADKPGNEIDLINEKAGLTEQIIENPKIYSSHKVYDFGSTTSAKSFIKRRQSVPSNFEVGLTPSPNQHLKEVSDKVSDSSFISRFKQRLNEIPDIYPKFDFSSTVAGNVEPKEKPLHKDEMTDMRTVFKVPEAISELAVSAKNNINQMESIFEKVSSAFTKGSTSSQYKRKARKRCGECGLFRSSSGSQKSVSFLRLPHLKGETCSSCGRYKRKEIKAEDIPGIRVIIPKERTKSRPFSMKIKQEFPQTLAQEIQQTLAQEIQQTLAQEIPQTMPQDIPKTVAQEIPQTIAQEIPQTIAQEIPQTIAQDIPAYKYLGAKIKIEPGIPQTRPQAIRQTMTQPIPKAMPQKNLQAMPQLNLATVNHFKQSEVLDGPFQLSTEKWKRCILCKLYKSEAGHFHSGLSIVLPHSEGRVCTICGGPEIQRKIINVADRPLKKIVNNAFVHIGSNEGGHEKNAAVLPITVKSEMDHLQNSVQPQTESQLQNINIAPAKSSVNNQQKYTGAIPKTTSRLKYKIDEAVNSIMGMGYANVGGRLTRLVESVNGDVVEALELLHLLDEM